MRDFIALIKLSLRDYFWRIDGRSRLNNRGVIWRLFWKYYVVISPCLIILLLCGIIRSILTAHLPFIYVLCFFVLLIMYSPLRLYNSIRYYRSAWYLNTKVKPSQVISDVGMYGEYVATMCVQNNLARNRAKGKIFNNVLIPRRDGNHSEVDIIAVSEMGIFVVEAKARQGMLSGNLLSPKWEQTMGASSFEFTNPIIQNIGHMNALFEYIYDNTENTNIREKSFIDCAMNVVLFSLQGVNYSNIDITVTPAMYWFAGMAEKGFIHQKFEKCVLTLQEVEIICEQLTKISGYTQEELKQAEANRQVRFARDEFDHRDNTVFYIANITVPFLDYKQIVVVKDDGHSTLFLDTRDNLFKAIPNAEIEQISDAIPYYEDGEKKIIKKYTQEYV